jgi:hypothetical protein
VVVAEPGRCFFDAGTLGEQRNRLPEPLFSNPASWAFAKLLAKMSFERAQGNPTFLCHQGGGPVGLFSEFTPI